MIWCLLLILFWEYCASQPHSSCMIANSSAMHKCARRHGCFGLRLLSRHGISLKSTRQKQVYLSVRHGASLEGVRRLLIVITSYLRIFDFLFGRVRAACNYHAPFFIKQYLSSLQFPSVCFSYHWRGSLQYRYCALPTSARLWPQAAPKCLEQRSQACYYMQIRRGADHCFKYWCFRDSGLLHFM